jgi:4-hydroxy-tetrahydrodipicolinate reductase
MHDAQIRVAIAGAGGRMGRQLIQAVQQMDGAALGAALEREGSSLLGSDAGELAGAGRSGVVVQSSLEAVKDDFDVFIDFTRPEGTLPILRFAVNTAKAWLSAPPGLTTPGSRRFATLRRRSPSCLPPTSASAST